MPRTGRPPLPTEVKRRRGTLRLGRTPTPLVIVPQLDIATIVDGPIVDAIVTSGATPWIGQSDAPTVRLAQRLWDDMEALRAALDEQFDPRVHVAYLGTVKELSSCLSKLGLSPSDRSRLGVAEVQAASALDRILDRRQSRRAS